MALFIKNHYSSKKLTRKQAVQEKIEFLQSLPNYRYCTTLELKRLASSFIISDIDRGLFQLIK